MGSQGLQDAPEHQFFMEYFIVFLNFKYLNFTFSIFLYIIIFITQIISPYFIFIDLEETDELKLRMSLDERDVLATPTVHFTLPTSHLSSL